MSMRFVTKVVGGAALGSAMLLFGSPSVVSAEGAPEEDGLVFQQANVSILKQEAAAEVHGDGDATAVNLAQVIQVNLGPIGLINVVCTENVEVNGEETDLEGFLNGQDVESLGDVAAMLEELDAVDNGDCEAEEADGDWDGKKGKKHHDKWDHDKGKKHHDKWDHDKGKRDHDREWDHDGKRDHDKFKKHHKKFDDLNSENAL